MASRVSPPFIIDAPSGTGKTYLTGKYPHLFADADKQPEIRAIYDHFEQKLGPHWWMTEAYSLEGQYEKKRMMSRVLGGLLTRLIFEEKKCLLTVEIDTISEHLEREVFPISPSVSSRIVCWLPPARVITARQEAKTWFTQPRFTETKNALSVARHAAIALRWGLDIVSDEEFPVSRFWHEEARHAQDNRDF